MRLSTTTTRSRSRGRTVDEEAGGAPSARRRARWPRPGLGPGRLGRPPAAAVCHACVDSLRSRSRSRRQGKRPHLAATASHPGDAEALWSTLHDALGLGDEGATVEVRGATGTVERVGGRQTLVRLTAPVPGTLSVCAWDEGGGKATAGIRAYLFSAVAAEYVRREEPAWQAWLQGISVPA